jgi:hypothetical protein
VNFEATVRLDQYRPGHADQPRQDTDGRVSQPLTKELAVSTLEGGQEAFTPRREKYGI